MMPRPDLQNQRDQFRSRLAGTTAAHERVDALNEWAWFERDFDLRASQSLSAQARALATTGEREIATYPRGLIAGLRTSGYLHAFMGMSVESADESLHALELMEATPCPDYEMDVRCNLIWAYLQMGEMEHAMRYALPALELARARHDRWGQVLMLDAIGYVYSSMGEPAEALANALRGLDLLRELGDVRGQGGELNNIAVHHLQLGNYALALEYVNASIELTRSAGFEFFYVNALGTAGEIYLAQKDYARARAAFEECICEAEKNHMQLAWVSDKMLLGRVYHETGYPQLAVSAVRDALQRATEHKIRLYEIQCHQLLAEMLEQQNDFQNALLHYKAYQELREQVMYMSSRRVNSLLTLNRLRETQQALAQVHRETESLRAALHEQKRARETLFALAIQDPLTGVFNRRHFTELATQHLQNDGANQCTALLLCDVDLFKEINDTLGHPVGDQVLKMVVGLIQENLRADDLLGRYGGDEFILLLPDTCGAKAKLVAERLRRTVETHAAFHNQANLHVSLSIGVTYCLPRQADDLAALIHAADAALYQSKRKGRNRTCLKQCIKAAVRR